MTDRSWDFVALNMHYAFTPMKCQRVKSILLGHPKFDSESLKRSLVMRCTRKIIRLLSKGYCWIILFGFKNLSNKTFLLSFQSGFLKYSDTEVCNTREFCLEKSGNSTIANVCLGNISIKTFSVSTNLSKFITQTEAECNTTVNNALAAALKSRPIVSVLSNCE